MRAAWSHDLLCSAVQLPYLPTRKPKASLQSSGLEDRNTILFNYKNATFVFTKVMQ